MPVERSKVVVVVSAGNWIAAELDAAASARSVLDEREFVGVGETEKVAECGDSGDQVRVDCHASAVCG